MFIQEFAFFSIVSLAQSVRHEIFILFFRGRSRPGNLYTFDLRIEKEGERATAENRGIERGEEKRRRTGKNHDAIIFVPARERILRPSGPDRWTEEEKKKSRKRLKARKKD